MATKRKPLRPSSSFNFRTDIKTDATKGTKLCQNPTSVQSVFALMLQHICRKYVFTDIFKRIAVYLGILFLLSLLADVLPFPRTYFSRKDNIFNLYFAKVAWGWTLLLAVQYTTLTSFVICCGDRNKILRHVCRLIVGTLFWYCWTTVFVYIERTFGRCNLKNPKISTKALCLEKGNIWQSLDISGHAFIFMYSSLMLIEEAKPIINWDSISDLIRDEEHRRSLLYANAEDVPITNNPLRNLSVSELGRIKLYYNKYSLYIKTLFCGMTLLIAIWDIMLFSTALYFHNMLEKVIAGLVAILTWYLTYRWAFLLSSCPLLLPGDGLFKYRETKKKDVPMKAQKVTSAVPKFMGMPIRVSKEEESNKKDADS